MSDIVEGIDLSIEFKDFPEILHRIDEWNSTVAVVNGRRLVELGSVVDTLSNDWFKMLDDFSKLRVLYYYYSARPHEKEMEYYQRTGRKVRDSQELANERAEFQAALATSKRAEEIWSRATADHHLDPPL